MIIFSRILNRIFPKIRTAPLPKARLQRVTILPNDEVVITYRPCSIVKDGVGYVVFDTEEDTILISQVSRKFLEGEVKRGRLLVQDDAWPAPQECLSTTA